MKTKLLLAMAVWVPQVACALEQEMDQGPDHAAFEQASAISRRSRGSRRQRAQSLHYDVKRKDR